MSVEIFEQGRLKLVLKAVAISIRSSPKLKGVFDIPTLTAIISACRSFNTPNYLFTSLFRLWVTVTQRVLMTPYF